MEKVNRNFSVEEEKILRKEIEVVTKEFNTPLKLTWLLAFSILTILSAIHIYYFDKSNWSILSKLLICVCPILIWITIEIKFKGRRKKKKYLGEIMTLAEKGIVHIQFITAQRVIIFKEKDDEGILYLIEESSGECFYLWDEQNLIPKKLNFPKQTIEIFLDRSFISAISRKVNCYGNKIEVYKITGDKKWAFFDKCGFPDDMVKSDKSFDEISNELKTLPNSTH